MPNDFEAVLKEKSIELPVAATPRANILPFKRVGNLVFLSGQICQWNGEITHKGKVGREYSTDEAYAAARLCALNLVAQLRAGLGGSLNGVEQCIRIGGYVNSVPEYTEQPKVINGCSDVVLEIFGEAGKHVRTAIGVSVLPFDVPVEADAVFSLT